MNSVRGYRIDVGSVSDGLARVVASIARAQSVAGPLVNRDALAVTPVIRLPTRLRIVAADVNRVSHALQQRYRIGRKAALQTQYVGHPLVMEARQVNRLLNIKSVIHHAHQDVGDGRDNARP